MTVAEKQDGLERVLVAAEKRWREAVKNLNAAREDCERLAIAHSTAQRELIEFLERERESGKGVRGDG